MTPSVPEPEPASAAAQSLEIAHVLFMDIVGYSKLPMEQQRTLLSELQEAIRNTEAFASAQRTEKLVSLPTGDGMALVFFGDPEFPVRCAMQLSRALREHPEIKLRMGIHTGPVYRVADINAASNIAGGGINMAQRVMDCGDAGHILVSNAVADVLAQLGEWGPVLRDLSETEVKHGVHIHIYNLCTDEVGNAELPSKWQKLQQQAELAARAKSKRRKLLLALVAAGVTVAVAVGGFLYSRRPQKLTAKDTIIVGDFANSTDDSVFDGTLKQALAIQLEQSPFLNVLAERRVINTLKLMNRPPEERLTKEVAREVCLRTNSKAVLTGSIAAVGDRYLIAVKAANCQSGDTLASAEATAENRNKVLDSLEEVGNKLRTTLGESLASVQKFNQPLVEATTSSLEALQAYSQGRRMRDAGAGDPIPLYKKVLELDPDFALAYLSLAGAYRSRNEMTLAIANFKKAYDLRHRVSDRERLYIESYYFESATGQLENAAQSYTELMQSYPEDYVPHGHLGFIYTALGQYEKAVPEMQETVRLTGTDLDYGNLIAVDLLLDRFHDAEAAFDEARAHKVDGSNTHDGRYFLAFLQGDSTLMQEQVNWAMGKPDIEDATLSHQSDSEAYYGRLVRARDSSQRAVNSATRSGQQETAAGWKTNEALREAEIGNLTRARQAVSEAFVLSTGRDVEGIAALTLARSGDPAQAEKLANKLNREFPLDTMMQGYLLPTIRAAIELNKNHPQRAVEILQTTVPYELGFATLGVISFGNLYPAYVRGEAYLKAGQGQQAATEFQKLIKHRGIVANFVTGALAHLQLGRAQAMSGDKEAARTSYRDFFTLWKDADLDIPILAQAKAEYAKLN